MPDRVSYILKSAKEQVIFMKKFLVNLEQTLGIDILYLAKNGAITLAGQVIAIICGFALNIAFANKLDKSILGQYQYLIAIIGFLTVITMPGMNTALIRGAAKNLNGIYFNVVNKIFRFAWIVALVVFIYSGIILFKGDYWLGFAILILGLLFPFYSVSGSWRAYVSGKEDFKTLNLIGSLSLIIQITVQLLIVYFWPNYFYLFLAYVLTALAINGPISFRLYHQTKTQSVDLNDIKYASQLSVALIFSMATGYVDKLVVGNFLGFDNLAVFSIAVLVPEQAKQMYSSLLLIHYPKFFKIKSVSTAKRQLLRLLAVLTIITTGLILLYVFISPWIFKYIFPYYQEVLPVSQVLMGTVIFTPLALLELFLRSERNTGDVFTYNIIGNILTIIASFVLIPIFGLWGVVISRYFSLIVSNIFLLTRFSASLPTVINNLNHGTGPD